MPVLAIPAFQCKLKGPVAAVSLDEISPATGLLEGSHKAVSQNPAHKLLYWPRQPGDKLARAMTSSMLLFQAVPWLVVH